MASRRTFLAGCAGVAAAGFAAMASADQRNGNSSKRTYHFSTNRFALEEDPELLPAVIDAGVTDLWLASYFFGHWYDKPADLMQMARKIESKGLRVHVINVPLGHPGDSLGAKSGNVPLTPPSHWKMGVKPNDALFSGTSLHAPATAENCAALKKLQAAGVRELFLDDDFRLAQGPGTIGGCFCSVHRKRFLTLHGYPDSSWDELLDDVSRRDLSRYVRQWVDFSCDELTASFRAQQRAAPQIRLGNMIMFMGAEKAGIRLKEYRNSLFRVGELMFDDRSFSSVRAKTQELFSVLFHRRYARPELAFSETTAFPANRLSARNMAAKLAISTIADVRNTMYMSGLTAFPTGHWPVLKPAMRKQQKLHSRLAGHPLRGPFKHFWGDAGRYVSDDNANCLFLAAGVPFEVVEAPGKEGVVFLGDHDAALAHNGQLRSAGALMVHRPGSDVPPGNARAVAETLPELFALKRTLDLTHVPHIVEDIPIVCAWYPTANCVFLWNPQDEPVTVTLAYKKAIRQVRIGALDSELLEGVG